VKAVPPWRAFCARAESVRLVELEVPWRELVLEKPFWVAGLVLPENREELPQEGRLVEGELLLLLFAGAEKPLLLPLPLERAEPQVEVPDDCVLLVAPPLLGLLEPKELRLPLLLEPELLPKELRLPLLLLLPKELRPPLLLTPRASIDAAERSSTRKVKKTT